MKRLRDTSDAAPSLLDRIAEKKARIMDVEPSTMGSRGFIGPSQYTRSGKRLYSRGARKSYRKKKRARKSYKKYGGKSAAYWKQRYMTRVATGLGDYRFSEGDSFGKRWGGYIGSKLGEYAGGGLQSILGLGDYSVRRNVFLSGRLPQMTNIAGNGGTVIRYQEYLTDIRTAGTADTFNIQSFILNPANEKSFPWLSQIAANYEQYEFEGMIYEFRSTSADALNSVNTALGTVMMATQYDTIDTVFASKAEMLNYEFSTSTKPSGNTLHMIECDPQQTSVPLLFTLSSEAPPPNTDARLYHLGRFSIATTGFQGTNVNIGELHVTYQIRLLKPKLAITLGADISEVHYENNVYANTFPFGNTTNAFYVTNTLGVTFTNNTLTIPSFPTNKKYLITFQWLGTLAAVTYPIFTWTNGVPAQRAIGPAGGESCTACTVTNLVTVAANAEMVCTAGGAGTLPASGNSFKCYIIELDNTQPF